MKKLKKEKIKKISFLTQRKNINDKLFDLKDHLIKTYPDSTGKFIRHGIKKLADDLEISVSTLDRYFKQGFINQKNDQLVINIERNFDKLKIKKLKKISPAFSTDTEKHISDFKGVTKQFTIHNFTFDNFFKLKPFGKIKENEQLYFKAGLYMVFSSGKRGTYTIQNLPLSHYSNLYPEGYKEFFEIIKFKLLEYPSLKFFRFNYFNVQKIQIDVIPIEQRIEKFKAKHKINNLKNEKTKKRR